MGKIVQILIVGMLVLSLGLGAVVTSAESTQQKEKNIYFSEPVIENKNEYVTISIDEADSYIMEQNMPMLPSYTQTFTFPLGTEITSVTCTRQNVETETISKEIMPTPIVLPVGTTTKPIIGTTNYNDPYPETYYEYNIGAGLSENRERKIIVKVSVYPVKYIPAQDTIEYAHNMKITVNYIPPSEPIFVDETYKFVILTANQFSGQIGNLATHKNNRGLSTKVVTLNEIDYGYYFPVEGRDDAEKIKYFIKNAIDNWGTTDVLLVGSSDNFPTRETHIKVSDDDDEIFVSDLYYADVYDEEMNFSSWDSNNNNVFAEYNWGDTSNDDDMDLFPDVRIGRIACTSTDEVTTIVNKIITYETNEAYSQDWFTNIVVIGGDTVPNDDEDPSKCIDEGEYLNQAVLNEMDGFIPNKIWDSNKKLSGLITTGITNINNGINSGCGFLDWSGHGASYIWTTYPHNGDRQTLPTPTGRYTNTIISELSNGDKLPIVMCGGCSLGKFQSDDDCFAWSYLSNPNGGGIASVGATGLGYVYLGRYVTAGLVEGFMLDLYKAYDDGATTFGEMWSWAIDEYISGRVEGHDYKTLTELIPFGDPTLAIRDESLPPIKPEPPTGTSNGEAGTEYTYEALTTDPESDKIAYLFDWGDGTYSGWTEYKNSGQTATGSHTWATQGSYNIRVLAKDIHGVQSEWSEPLPITMPTNQPQDSLLIKIIQLILNTFPSLEPILGPILSNLLN